MTKIDEPIIGIVGTRRVGIVIPPFGVVCFAKGEEITNAAHCLAILTISPAYAQAIAKKLGDSARWYAKPTAQVLVYAHKKYAWMLDQLEYLVERDGKITENTITQSRIDPVAHRLSSVKDFGLPKVQLSMPPVLPEISQKFPISQQSSVTQRLLEENQESLIIRTVAAQLKLPKPYSPEEIAKIYQDNQVIGSNIRDFEQVINPEDIKCAISGKPLYAERGFNIPHIVSHISSVKSGRTIRSWLKPDSSAIICKPVDGSSAQLLIFASSEHIGKLYKLTWLSGMIGNKIDKAMIDDAFFPSTLKIDARMTSGAHLPEFAGRRQTAVLMPSM